MDKEPVFWNDSQTLNGSILKAEIVPHRDQTALVKICFSSKTVVFSSAHTPAGMWDRHGEEIDRAKGPSGI